jgi:prephenate dehydrogenase
MKRRIISIYGYGRFGKLWADILSADYTVQVYSRRGLKPAEVGDNQRIVTEEQLFECDAMFFCVSISSFEDVLQSCKKFYKKETVYFDTCSVKVYPTQWMQQNLPGDAQIIATHPMFGPDSYLDKCNELPIVMCDVRTDGNTFQQWSNYFSGKSMRVEKMTAEKHDEMVAYSQGITHYVGRVLADLNLKATSIATLGYEKILEIIEQTCNDSWQLFLDLQQYNPYTEKMRNELYDSLLKIYSIFLTKDSKK